MALSTRIKELSNSVLSPLNVRVDSRTAERLEQARLQQLAATGHFDRPVFPTPRSFIECDATKMFEQVNRYEDCFATLADAEKNTVGYSFDNIWFTSPDAEILYTLIREHRPKTVLEVGCGNSTRVTRQAIRDGQLDTRLIAVDPQPRRDVDGLVDEFIQQPVERLTVDRLIAYLEPGDVLFIDSSHCVTCGNDVVFLLLQVVPNLAAGVLIHLHDIFLPYDYPQDWIVEQKRGWNEQYLVQAMLMFGDQFEVVWPGHYLQRTSADFASRFPYCNGRPAQSLWVRKTQEPILE